jgi:hypothetical protein
MVITPFRTMTVPFPCCSAIPVMTLLVVDWQYALIALSLYLTFTLCKGRRAHFPFRVVTVEKSVVGLVRGSSLESSSSSFSVPHGQTVRSDKPTELQIEEGRGTALTRRIDPEYMTTSAVCELWRCSSKGLSRQSRSQMTKLSCLIDDLTSPPVDPRCSDHYLWLQRRCCRRTVDIERD